MGIPSPHDPNMTRTKSKSVYVARDDHCVYSLINIQISGDGRVGMTMKRCNGGKSAVITEVRPNSSACSSGVKVGDQPVDGTGMFIAYDVFRKLCTGKKRPLRFTIRRAASRGRKSRMMKKMVKWEGRVVTEPFALRKQIDALVDVVGRQDYSCDAPNERDARGRFKRRLSQRECLHDGHPCNVIDERHKKFAEKHMEEDELRMYRSGTIKSEDILSFVDSWGTTYFGKRRGGLNCHCNSEQLFDANNDAIKRKWKDPLKLFYHIVVHHGRHFYGISLDKQNRIMYVYDPKIDYNLRSATRTRKRARDKCHGVIKSSKTYRWDLNEEELEGGAIRANLTAEHYLEKIKRVYRNVRLLEGDSRGIRRTKCEGESIEERIGYCRDQWSIELVKEFYCQQNDYDCGAFTALFFECLSRGCSLVAGESAVGRKIDLDKYRKWMAFSCCVHRMQKTIKQERASPSISKLLQQEGLVEAIKGKDVCVIE